MPREFDVPPFYRSAIISRIKQLRRDRDPKRRDLSPTTLDCGPVRFKIARHFGFCFGVENAIDIAYRAVADNPSRRVFLLSEMIHNPEVNADLERRGVSFLMRTDGTRLVDFSTLSLDDVVIVPAFGTTLELQRELASYGVDPYFHDATCPFVEKVWKRAAELGAAGYTVVIHGKRTHEETRATFSHSVPAAPTIIVRDMEEASVLVGFIRGSVTGETLLERFGPAVSPGFEPVRDLQRVGVINQTTMLASETWAIAQAIRDAMRDRYGQESLSAHFADTRDTLCYATNENQGATKALIDSGADIAIVVGGYNSSNTSHLVELAEERMPTFYIKNAQEILSRERIRHFDLHEKAERETRPWLPDAAGGTGREPIVIGVTAGASCPDRIVDEVVEKIRSFFPGARALDDAARSLESAGAEAP